MFGSLMNRAKEKMQGLTAEAQKYKNKDMLNAYMAGAAMIAAADGNIDPEEKEKAMLFVQNNEALSVFSRVDILESFNNFVEGFSIDFDLGEAKCLDALAKLKGKPDQARLAMRMVVAIGKSDGDFDKQERRAADKIAAELGIDTIDFE